MFSTNMTRKQKSADHKLSKNDQNKSVSSNPAPTGREATAPEKRKAAPERSGSNGRNSISPNLKAFSLIELKSATRNFRPDSVLGEGGFGRVFKGWIDEHTLTPSKVGIGMPVAVKKSSNDSSQGVLEWQVIITIFRIRDLYEALYYYC